MSVDGPEMAGPTPLEWFVLTSAGLAVFAAVVAAIAGDWIGGLGALVGMLVCEGCLQYLGKRRV